MLKLQIAAVTLCSIFKNLEIQKHEVGDQFHLSINSNPTVGGIPKYRNNRNVISISFKFRFLASIKSLFFLKNGYLSTIKVSQNTDLFEVLKETAECDISL